MGDKQLKSSKLGAVLCKKLGNDKATELIKSLTLLYGQGG